jgi:hypothetical protein
VVSGFFVTESKEPLVMRTFLPVFALVIGLALGAVGGALSAHTPPVAALITQLTTDFDHALSTGQTTTTNLPSTVKKGLTK